MLKRSVVIVGGSLVGIAAALALHRHGWTVTVFERSTLTTPVGGSGIGVDRTLLSRITGISRVSFPVIEESFEQTTWALVYAALLHRMLGIRDIAFRADSRVVSADDAGQVTVETAEGLQTCRADLVLGADGHASLLRSIVDPQRKNARYAGYMMWRGLIDETTPPAGFHGTDMAFSARYFGRERLVTFGVPGRDGETDPGHRRASFSWFDTGRRTLLESQGRLRGDVARGAIAATSTPSEITAAMAETAQRWPAPWGSSISGAIRRLEFVGTPISEYYPTRLVRGRLALLGDAAHVVSPVTGAGFHNGLLDIQALVASLHSQRPVAAALDEFERLRLRPAQALVRESQRWSEAFISGSSPDGPLR
jgi:2-polyprenyl-6-methoxyphenol hydroxylase-like FAD-dependent oxidoreductase